MNIKEIDVKDRVVGDRILIGDPLNIIDYPILYKKYSIENNKTLYFYANSEIDKQDVVFRDTKTKEQIAYKCFGQVDHISDMILQLLSNKKILISDKVFEKKIYEGNYGDYCGLHKEVFLKHGYIIDLVNKSGFDFLEKNKNLAIDDIILKNNIISNKFCVVKLKKDTYFKLISIDNTEHLIYFKENDWNILGGKNE